MRKEYKEYFRYFPNMGALKWSRPSSGTTPQYNIYYLKADNTSFVWLKIGRTCPPPVTCLGRPPNIIAPKGQNSKNRKKCTN